uniref:(northern house mosquito) hypothetical protein n=1 Tax=Culex pipiens TaxID=7175 RepID=A0A8D8CXD6_CULPI
MGIATLGFYGSDLRPRTSWIRSGYSRRRTKDTSAERLASCRSDSRMSIVTMPQTASRRRSAAPACPSCWTSITSITVESSTICRVQNRSASSRKLLEYSARPISSRESCSAKVSSVRCSR